MKALIPRLKTKTKSMKRSNLLLLSLLLCIPLAQAQTNLFKDDFSGPNLSGWQPSMSVSISASNHQFIATDTFLGRMDTNNPGANSGDGYHFIPNSGPLPDNQTLEGRVDVVRVNQEGVWAEIHFWGDPEAASYVFYKSADAVGLMKVWNWASSGAWLFYDGLPLKNEQVTLVLALTRRGSNLEINTRVLDKDNADSILFDRTAIDTPQADPVLLSRSVWGAASMTDPPGTPPPILSAPKAVALGVMWTNALRGPQPAAQVSYAHLEVWQYPTPRRNVVAWGDNSQGQAGVPLSVTNAVAVAAGGNTSLALRSDGTVVAWGRGAADFPAGLSNVVALAAGSYTADFGVVVCHALALRADWTAVEWWYSESMVGASASTEVVTGLTNVVALAAGKDHSLALRADGTVLCWGGNDWGQTNVPPRLSNVVAVAAGADHSLALRRDGTVVAWGGTPPPFAETNVPPGLSDVVEVAAGEQYSLALRPDGTLVAWGFDAMALTNTPTDLTNAVALVVVGRGDVPYGAALRANGTPVGWNLTGNPSDPELYGLTNTIGLTNVVAIAGGVGHCLALIGEGPPVIQTSLNDPTVSAEGFSVSVPTQSGHVYALEYKNTLADPAWIPLPLVAGTGHEQTLTDPTANGPQRFYRVRRW